MNAIDSWETECNVMEDVRSNRSAFQLKKDLVNKMLNTAKPHGDEEPYEMTLGKKEVEKIIDDYKMACEDAIHQYDVLFENLERIREVEKAEEEKERALQKRCEECEPIISSNNVVLDEENRKR